MDDIDRLIQKYDEARANVSEYEKKLQKYKERIEKYCRDNNVDNYENAAFTLKKQSQTRTAMTKKSVPEDVWDKYCTVSKIEFFTVKRKKDAPV